MTKGKVYCLTGIFISTIIAAMIVWKAGNFVYAADGRSQTSLQAATPSDVTTAGITATAATSSDVTGILPTLKWGNNWIYDVNTPLDLYGSDKTTTRQVQVVAPESSFQVIYSQEYSDLVSTMASVLSSLDTDTISNYSGDVYIYFAFPLDVDTSGISASSFTLEGSYSLFNIVGISQEQQDTFMLIELLLSLKTSYSSVGSLLSTWQEDTDAGIIISGLSVPSAYNLGDIFYIHTFPRAMVNVPVGDITYQFEAIADSTAGDDGMTDDTFPYSQSTDIAHVTFQVGVTAEETTEEETTADNESATEDITEAATEDTTEITAENSLEAATGESTEITTEETAGTETRVQTGSSGRNRSDTSTKDKTNATTGETIETAVEVSTDTGNTAANTDDFVNTENMASEADLAGSDRRDDAPVRTGDESCLYGWLTVSVISLAVLSVWGLKRGKHFAKKYKKG